MADQQKKSYTAAGVYAFLWYVPVVAILAVTPLIVYLTVLPVPETFRKFWISDFNFDFFSFCKARWFIIWSVVLLLSFLLCLYKRKDEYLSFAWRTKYFWIVWIVFTLSILLSAVFSPVPQIAWGGMFDRYEGGWVWVSYCLLLAASAFLLRHDTDFRYFTGAIIFSTTIIALIGVFQYFGMDLFRSDFGQWIILPAKFITAKFGFTFGKGKIYSTFYNTNYGGNIAGIALPLAVCRCLFVSGFKRGATLLLGYALLIFVLATGSRSQAGAFGLFVAFTFLIIYLVRHDRSKLKHLALIFTLFIPIFIGMDIYADGAISGKFVSTFLIKKLAVQPPVEDTPLKDQTQPPVGDNLLNEQKQPLTGDALLNEQKKMIRNNLMQVKDRVLFGEAFFDEKIIDYGHLGGGRGYIYLRALELLLKSPSWLGTGPDTFILSFPQEDAYRLFGGFPRPELIDKMHSMFLQIWFNTGPVSFITFVLMLLLHFANSVQIFWKIQAKTYIEVHGLGFFLGWMGFLGAALFNDSAISVSPYFWAVFGASIAANYVIRSTNPLFTGILAGES